ncbi:hypothetical protein B0H10DRAFT_1950198 [Mycena sp. CBHHK59/15]|nr:hypothetical protein B0H10DRAFT_1950198 [Mycena sp. CBHHK59/15]
MGLEQGAGGAHLGMPVARGQADWVGGAGARWDVWLQSGAGMRPPLGMGGGGVAAGQATVGLERGGGGACFGVPAASGQVDWPAPAVAELQWGQCMWVWSSGGGALSGTPAAQGQVDWVGAGAGARWGIGRCQAWALGALKGSEVEGGGKGEKSEVKPS